MSADREALGRGVRAAGLAALTCWLTMLSWRGLSLDSAGYLVPLFVGGILVAVSGALLRWSRLPGVVVVAVQVVLLIVYANLVLVGSPLPWGEGWQELTESLRLAVESARTYPAPIPLLAPSITPLLVPLGLALLLAVDALAGTLRRVPLAGLALLVAYTIPVSLLEGGVSWIVFLLSATGFLAMLFIDEQDQVSRWGRLFGRTDSGANPPGFSVRTGTSQATALGIGSAAAVAALILPVAVPTLELAIFSGGVGAGGGDVHVANPMTDLRRDLRQGRDVPLVRISTDDPHPAYLRISALTRFTSNEWSTGDRQVPVNHRADGKLPPPEGVADPSAGKQYDYRISTFNNFDSIWLPTMVPATSVEAAGDWRYDDTTMDFLSANDNTNTAGLDYALSALTLDYSPKQLEAASTPPAGLLTTYTKLPEDMPIEVGQLADQVMGGQTNKFLKAVALQRWFREDGGFTYDLTTRAGNGTDELVQFLDDKHGYCEQFASAMAVMARMEGIPARVAVGFLRPDSIGTRLWEYSSHDLHAWVELYFAGSGWVAFDPTPAARSGAAPAYTTVSLPDPSTGSSASAPTNQPSDDLASRDTSASARPDRDQEADATTSTAAAKIPWQTIMIGLLVALVLGFVGILPRLVRRLRRDHRWSSWTAPEAAWAELADTMVDLGRPWPGGLSPRTAAERLIDCFGSPQGSAAAERPRRGPGQAPQAEEALHQIVQAVELSRYAPPGTSYQDSLREQTEVCATALADGATAAARRRARWLPRSVLRRHPPATTTTVEVVGRGDLVDHVN